MRSLAAALLLACALSVPPLAAESPSLATKVFTVRHRAVQDVVTLIQPALSERGSFAVQPRIKTVTVTDTEQSLQKVEALIAGYDLPPRGIGLVFQLMRAEEGPPAPADAKRPARRMGLPPSVIQDVTKWGVITQIGGASISTAEKESGSVALGEEFRVQFEMGAVTTGLGVAQVRMDRFVLEKIRRGPDGAARYTPLMDLVLNLKSGQTSVMGATSSQDSKQALFVSIVATAQEP
ncbi:MAG TPA: secretin N-terminal domain-containing protein [Candidatus Polarisedimenticolia bacterium]|nr:secretin N-terminal domain-containing protein [Candidatus Polarisedimenticolia bacterium]